ncbi:unnamed protein product [Mytilus coruscus]|uniref:non-specific serine/threonine protein kinase n=1 Tax=Mytilus coruscus TaxID=42192 RepID=A0A6J8A8J7_MYTCO|nr:unnamed protein product [Mytilus coruscus]
MSINSQYNPSYVKPMFYLQKLITAAQYGAIEVVKLCIENITDVDYEDCVNTALLEAASNGHLEVIKFLFISGCKKEATENDGRTALHLAAECGSLRVTRYLVEQIGISPLVTTHQTVMLEKSSKVTTGLETEVPTEIELMADKRYVPLYLKLIESGSEKKRDIRLVIVGKKGAGKTSFIKRLLNERKKSAGITSLMKRFFRGTNAEITSTNGIDIHTIKCKSKSSDGIWNKLDGNYEETDLYARLLKPYEEKLTSAKRATIDEGTHDTVKDNTLVTILYRRVDKSKESRTVSQLPEKIKPLEDTQVKLPLATEFQVRNAVANEEHLAFTESQVKDQEDTESQIKSPLTTEFQVKYPLNTESQVKPQVTNINQEQQETLLLEKAVTEIKTMIERSKVELNDKEEYATFLFWDFAGDEEFYHTHQTFLSSDAIYIVVTKLNEVEDTNAHDMFQLWMNSIHCYCTREQRNKPESNTTGMNENNETYASNTLDPPVILVGSHKDKVRHSKGEKIESACRDHLDRFVNDISDDACRHIRHEYFISNTEDDDYVFQQIRQDIVHLASTMSTWNKDYPLKFIQLEKRLQKKKKELQIPVISFHDIKHISTEIPKPLNEEELRLFLEFHHEIRALVYFNDLPDFIILDTQWLSDVFKCIVTAKKFKLNVSRHRMKEKLEDLHVSGILHSEVLEDIFKDKTTVLYEQDQHKENILNIMKKFDIIIPAIRSSPDDKPCYYVPCMVKSKPENDIYEMFNVTNDTCKKSTWLCFKFRVLPPHLINHLIASLSRNYNIAVVDTTGQEKNQIALFGSTAVFELQKTTKLRKLLVMTCPNLIQIQILEFKKEIKTGMYKDIAAFVTDEINKIISRRFKMSNVKFEKKWKCELTKPNSVTGLIDFSAEQDTVYYCEACATKHEFNNEWSDLEIRTPCLSQTESFENVPRSNPYIESSGQVQNTGTSTKVRVRVKAGERVFSNVNEGATGTASSAGVCNITLYFHATFFLKKKINKTGDVQFSVRSVD